MDNALHQEITGISTVRGVRVVLENLPGDLPVLDAEIAVLETYLGDFVDRIFSEIEYETRTVQKSIRVRD
jgi:hypothetical protein